ncbi:MAG: Lar family restriction alleviation protein [Sphaerochaeta sp.]|jgi:Lar family restriction alleviation protein|nr:Lar family restriction alleviation protein [Sphaerochaeta sp.]
MSETNMTDGGDHFYKRPVVYVLRPCPFCGSSDVEVLDEVGPRGLPYCYVICQVCDAIGPPNIEHGGAVKNWNTRNDDIPF